MAESSICQSGGSNGIIEGIIIGDDRGTIDAHNAMLPSGSPITLLSSTIETIIGIVTGKVSDCISPSSFTAAPMAAKSAP